LIYMTWCITILHVFIFKKRVFNGLILSRAIHEQRTYPSSTPFFLKKIKMLPFSCSTFYGGNLLFKNLETDKGGRERKPRREKVTILCCHIFLYPRLRNKGHSGAVAAVSFRTISAFVVHLVIFEMQHLI